MNKVLLLLSLVFVVSCGDNIQPDIVYPPFPPVWKPDAAVVTCETCEECPVCEEPAECPVNEPKDPCECFHEDDVVACLDDMIVLHRLCGRSNYEARFACTDGVGNSVYQTVNIEGCDE